MASLKRVRAEWSGSGLVGSGVSTFMFLESGTGLVAAVEAFFDALAGYIPNDVSITIPAAGDIVESTTGELVGAWSEGAVSGTTNGTFIGTYPRGVGTRFVWETEGIVNGRRIKGSTFLVPFGASNFDDGGQLSAAASALLTGIGNDLIDAAGNTMVVWSRPRPDGDSGYSVVTSCRVPRNPSWLRTRKT